MRLIFVGYVTAALSAFASTSAGAVSYGGVHGFPLVLPRLPETNISANPGASPLASQLQPFGSQPQPFASPLPVPVTVPVGQDIPSGFDSVPFESAADLVISVTQGVFEESIESQLQGSVSFSGSTTLANTSVLMGVEASVTADQAPEPLPEPPAGMIFLTAILLLGLLRRHGLMS